MSTQDFVCEQGKEVRVRELQNIGQAIRNILTDLEGTPEISFF